MYIKIKSKNSIIDSLCLENDLNSVDSVVNISVKSVLDVEIYLELIVSLVIMFDLDANFLFSEETY